MSLIPQFCNYIVKLISGWILRGGPYSSNPSSVKYLDGQFVLVGGSKSSPPYEALVVTSPDGITWTNREGGGALGTSRDAADVAYGNGVLVMVGDSGRIASSADDGVTWTVRNTTGSDLWAVCFDGTRFIAVGSANQVFTCADAGVTWVEQTTGGTWAYAWRGAASDGSGNTVIAGWFSDGFNLFGGIMHTANGSDWTEVVVTSSFEPRGVYPGGAPCVKYSDGKYVVYGETSFYTSVNGLTSWSETSDLPAEMIPSPSDNEIQDVLFVNDFWLVSTNNSSGNIRMATSPDLEDWTLIANENSPFTEVRTMAHNGVRIVGTASTNVYSTEIL